MQVSTISAISSPLFGLLFGLIMVNNKSSGARLLRWVPISLLLAGAGIGVHFAGFPLNKNLYSSSYVLLMAGFAGGLFSFVYLLLDVWPTAAGKWLSLPFVAYVLCVVC